MFWTYLAVYAVIFAVLSVIAVSNKNRSQGGWFLIGLIFGVFGFIAALIVGKRETSPVPPARATRFDAATENKKCPACAELIKLEAKVCRFCQHHFSDEEVAAQITAAESEWMAKRPARTSRPELDEADVQQQWTKYSDASTDKLLRMKRQGLDHWRKETLVAVDRILESRGVASPVSTVGS